MGPTALHIQIKTGKMEPSTVASPSNHLPTLQKKAELLQKLTETIKSLDDSYPKYRCIYLSYLDSGFNSEYISSQDDLKQLFKVMQSARRTFETTEEYEEKNKAGRKAIELVGYFWEFSKNLENLPNLPKAIVSSLDLWKDAGYNSLTEDEERKNFLWKKFISVLEEENSTK